MVELSKRMNGHGGKIYIIKQGLAFSGVFVHLS